VQEEVPLVHRASGIPDDSISLFAKESSLQGTTAQEASFRHPTSLDLDVEPYLSRPQVDSRTPGFSENVLYVADLLQLPKRKDDSASFCNMSEQLLTPHLFPAPLSLSCPLSDGNQQQVKGI